jgi:hypothetical protein
MAWVCDYYGETRNLCKILERKPFSERPVRRPRKIWWDNISMDFREMVPEDGWWMELAENCVYWPGFILAALLPNRNLISRTYLSSSARSI